MQILAYVLLGLGCYLIALNYAAMLRNRRNRRLGIDKYQSSIPLIGGLLAGGGLYLLTRQPLAWLLAVADPGIWTLLLLPVALARQRR